MSKHIKYFLLISCLSIVINSCSKDEPTVTPEIPKLLKEVKMAYDNQITGLRDSTISVYDYNDKQQIIKITYPLHPGNYSTLEYIGDLPMTRKEYVNNVLVETQINYTSISGNTITLTYDIDQTSSTYDTIKRRFTLEGKNMTVCQSLLINNTGDDIDGRQYFTYAADDVTSTWYKSFKDGISNSTPVVSSVKQRDDKFNPYSTLSPMNKALCGPVEEIYVHGIHNVLQIETPGYTGELYQYTYDKDGYALTMKEPGPIKRVNTYTYTR